MALREQARKIVAAREGYRLVLLSLHDYRTTFIVSHKGRAVGGYVEFADGGAPEAASSVSEAAEWWRADNGAERLGVCRVS